MYLLKSFQPLRLICCHSNAKLELSASWISSSSPISVKLLGKNANYIVWTIFFTAPPSFLISVNKCSVMTPFIFHTATQRLHFVQRSWSTDLITSQSYFNLDVICLPPWSQTESWENSSCKSKSGCEVCQSGLNNPDPVEPLKASDSSFFVLLLKECLPKKKKVEICICHVGPAIKAPIASLILMKQQIAQAIRELVVCSR